MNVKVTKKAKKYSADAPVIFQLEKAFKSQDQKVVDVCTAKFSQSVRSDSTEDVAMMQRDIEKLRQENTRLKKENADLISHKKMNEKKPEEQIDARGQLNGFRNTNICEQDTQINSTYFQNHEVKDLREKIQKMNQGLQQLVQMNQSLTSELQSIKEKEFENLGLPEKIQKVDAKYEARMDQIESRIGIKMDALEQEMKRIRGDLLQQDLNRKLNQQAEFWKNQAFEMRTLIARFIEISANQGKLESKKTENSPNLVLIENQLSRNIINKNGVKDLPLHQKTIVNMMDNIMKGAKHHQKLNFKRTASFSHTLPSNFPNYGESISMRESNHAQNRIGQSQIHLTLSGLNQSRFHKLL